MYNMQQQYNITNLAVTMMTLGLMSSLFGGITGGIGGSAVMMPHVRSSYTITLDDIKREAIRRTGEYWDEAMYESLMRDIIQKIHRLIIEEIDYFTAKYTTPYDVLEKSPIKRIRREEI